jgi:hypothetical protein
LRPITREALGGGKNPASDVSNNAQRNRKVLDRAVGAVAGGGNQDPRTTQLISTLSYMDRLAARPNVHETLKAEGRHPVRPVAGSSIWLQATRLRRIGPNGSSPAARRSAIELAQRDRYPGAPEHTASWKQTNGFWRWCAACCRSCRSRFSPMRPESIWQRGMGFRSTCHDRGVGEAERM